MGDTGNGRKKESKSEIVKRKNLHRVTQRSSEVTEENHEKRKTKNKIAPYERSLNNYSLL